MWPEFPGSPGGPGGPISCASQLRVVCALCFYCVGRMRRGDDIKSMRIKSATQIILTYVFDELKSNCACVFVCVCEHGSVFWVLEELLRTSRSREVGQIGVICEGFIEIVGHCFGV